MTGRKNAGIALIALEGLPARPFRVGSKIGETYTLNQVTTRTAILAAADGAASITLELAPAASTTNAAPVQIPYPSGFPAGQSPFPFPIPTPTLPKSVAPAGAGPLPPAAPVDASRD